MSLRHLDREISEHATKTDVRIIDFVGTDHPALPLMRHKHPCPAESVLGKDQGRAGGLFGERRKGAPEP